MGLPQFILEQIKEGKVVLFLGSGASKEAINSIGENPPTGQELARMISEKYLDGKYNNNPLNEVSELAINEFDLLTVQEFIRSIFVDFIPTNAHKLLNKFSWCAIVTTNYDTLIEQAYSMDTKKTNIPIAFIEDGDRIDERLRSSKSFPLIKLHGCITRINNTNCPLIMSTEQYILHKKCRKRLFDQFEDLGYEHSIIFIGQSLQDPDIRNILMEISQNIETRPSYYIIAPNLDKIQERFWTRKKIYPVKGTFKDFMDYIDSSITSPFKGLPSKVKHKIPILSRLKKPGVNLTESTLEFLEVDVEYVNNAKASQIIDPKLFYRGYNPDWTGIEQNLDVRRNTSDNIILDNFIGDKKYIKQVRFIIIKGHAGSGKTVALKRIAWDASHDYDCLCLYVKKYGKFDVKAIKELLEVFQERIYLFVDNVVDRVHEIENFISSFDLKTESIVIIGAARINEWNTECESLEDYVSKNYQIHYLSEAEIDKLLKLLRNYGALGVLKNLTNEEQKKEFVLRAGRQLLVALHEATLGKVFEEIIIDEYKNIKPVEAKEIYLTICTLNRLNVPVRAGIISRIHDVPFTEFKKRLFKPLEKVVHTSYVDPMRTFIYRARHYEIAQIIFDNVFKNQEDKFERYIKILKELNVDYSCDREAFQKMISWNMLHNLFSNKEFFDTIFKYALTVNGREFFVYHQMAIYEMQKKKPNLDKSANLLNKASTFYPNNSAILHSFSELNIKRAKIGKTDLEKLKYLGEAELMGSKLIDLIPYSPFGYHTYSKANIEILKLHLEKDSTKNILIGKVIGKIEKCLTTALQLLPGNSYLLSSYSDLSKLILRHEAAYKYLIKAFDVNPRNEFVAIRLYDYLIAKQEVYDAKTTIIKAISANRSNRLLNYTLAKHLIEYEKKEFEEILYHLKRSFTPGDKHYIAQILYGKYLFIKDSSESINFFKSIRDRKSPPALRNKLSFHLEEKFTGEIINLHSDYCFIKRDGIRDNIFTYINNVNQKVWEKLLIGTKVKFMIAFTLRGPNAYEVETI